MGYTIIICLFVLWVFQKHGIPVFLYHQVQEGSPVTPELFESHLKYLKKKGFETLTMSEYIENGADKNSILLTLDDGYYDNYQNVFPLLKKYNMKATIFLNSWYIQEKREEAAKVLSNNQANQEAVLAYMQGGTAKSPQYMSWEEIKEMQESGLLDFQAHTHKHMAVFADIKLEGFKTGEEADCTDTYLYGGKVEEGYPVFRKRGEYTQYGYKIDPAIFPKFAKKYREEWKKLPKKEALAAGKRYLEKYKDAIKIQTKEDFLERIREDFLENKREIEGHLGTKVTSFCWPWGHRSKEAREYLESLGVKAFVSTKKGTNDQLPNRHCIYRVELRNYSLEKFRLNVFVTSNLILGKLYALVS